MPGWKETQALEAQYQQDLAEWNSTRDAHEKARAEIEKAIRLAARDIALKWSARWTMCFPASPGRKKHLEYEFSHDVTGIALDIDLPEEGDVPNRTAEAKGNGKLSFKTRSEAQTRKDFVSLCYGTVFVWLGRYLPCSQASNSALLPGTFSAQILQRDASRIST